MITITTLLLVFFIDHLRSINHQQRVRQPLCHFFERLVERLSIVKSKAHGRLFVVLMMMLPLLIIVLVSVLLAQTAWWILLIWHTTMLYLVLGMSRFFSTLSDLEQALFENDEPRIQSLLQVFTDISCEGLSSSEIVQLILKVGFTQAYRHIFVVLFGYLLLGPVGAWLYPIVWSVADVWEGKAQRDGDEHRVFADFAAQIVYYLEWLPVRVMVLLFAVVGNFEDALKGCCAESKVVKCHYDDWIIQSGIGALGMMESLGRQSAISVSEGGQREWAMADVDYVRGLIGLLLRSMAVLVLVAVVVRIF